jgi:membrane protein DedA with SNARE-associated domain
MQPQTKVTLGEIALLLIIAAEVILFIGYTKPGHSILSSLGLTAPSANSMPTLTRPKP